MEKIIRFDGSKINRNEKIDKFLNKFAFFTSIIMLPVAVIALGFGTGYTIMDFEIQLPIGIFVTYLALMLLTIIVSANFNVNDLQDQRFITLKNLNIDYIGYSKSNFDNLTIYFKRKGISQHTKRFSMREGVSITYNLNLDYSTQKAKEIIKTKKGMSVFLMSYLKEFEYRRREEEKEVSDTKGYLKFWEEV